MLGASLDFSALQAQMGRLDETLFGETHASYIISYAPEQEVAIQAQLKAKGLDALTFYALGVVSDSGDLVINADRYPVALLQQAWQAD